MSILISGIQEERPASIAVGYSRLMARQLHLQEKDLGALLRGSGLSVSQLMDDATLLTNDQQLQIMSNALDYSGNPGFGLQLGQSLTPPAHGPLGFLANSSPNLITAIRDFQSFIPGRVSLFECRTEYEADKLACYFDLDIKGNLELYRCMSECFFLSLISLIEYILGEAFTDGCIYCNYAKPAYFEEYKKTIHCPIRFSATANKLELPEKLFFTANVSSDYQNYKYALQQCEKMLGELANTDNGTTGRVKRQLLSHPPGQLSEMAVARLNFISKRTLARRLKAEMSSFQELRDGILATLASDYLRDTALSVESIAGLLNYHDSSSFRRAFKRWTSKTPQQYREANARSR